MLLFTNGQPHYQETNSQLRRTISATPTWRKEKVYRCYVSAR